MPNRLASFLPHTSRLLDVRYLLGAAILSRLAVGVARCIVDIPKKSTTPSLSPQSRGMGRPQGETHKDQVHSFEERVFMEMLGVPAHVTSMQLIQDGVSHLLQKTRFLKPPSLASVEKLTALSATEKQVVGDVLNRFAQTAKHPIADTIYSPKAMMASLNGVYDDVLAGLNKLGGTQGKTVKALSTPLKNALTQSVHGWHQRALAGSGITLLAGLLGGALFAGMIWQRISDGVFSKGVIPFLDRLGVGAPHTHANQPATSPETTNLQAPVSPALLNLNDTPPLSPLPVALSGHPTGWPTAPHIMSYNPTSRPISQPYMPMPRMMSPAYRPHPFAYPNTTAAGVGLFNRGTAYLKI